MEACVQHSREIFLEGRLIQISLEIVVGICTIILTIIAIVEFVRSDKWKK